MIVNLIQTQSFKNSEWVLDENSKDIAIARSPFEIGQVQIFFESTVGIFYKLYYNPTDTSYGRKFKDRFKFHIFENNEYVGYIIGGTEGRFFKGYIYTDVNYKGKIYKCYEVGFGRNGLFLCIYDEDTLVAIVEKELKTINFKDKYTLYLLSSEYLPVASMYTLYYDKTTYDNTTDISVRSSSTSIKYCHSKELKAKYDPAFIQKIKDNN